MNLIFLNKFPFLLLLGLDSSVLDLVSPSVHVHYLAVAYSCCTDLDILLTRVTSNPCLLLVLKVLQVLFSKVVLGYLLPLLLSVFGIDS